MATAPAFRDALKRRRCLVPADGFYEWQKLDGKVKQRYAIALQDGPPLAFAGLWERWMDKATAQSLETYTIITTDPNELTAPIHNRMPVILAPKDRDRWMAPTFRIIRDIPSCHPGSWPTYYVNMGYTGTPNG